MNRKFLAVMLCFVFFSTLASAQFYVLERQEIEITVDEEGNANVVERYFMRFQNEQQLFDFQQTKSEIGISVEGWNAYDPRLFPKIGQENDIEVRSLLFNESTADFLEVLEMNYVLKEPLMEKKVETSRVIDFEMKKKFFNEFVEGPFGVIPAGTTVKIMLPIGVEIQSSVKPDASIEGNLVTWTGYVSGNEFELKYSSFKQIASFDLREAIQQLFQSDLFIIMVLVVAAIALILFVKRKRISASAERYIVRHSDLGGLEEED